MHPILNRNLYFVKEHVGLLKAASNYDVYDPETGEQIIHCREERIGMLTKMLRFTDYSRMTPFHVDVRTAAGEDILSVRRGISFVRSNVEVLNESDTPIGGFRQALFSIGGKFAVLGADGQPLCTLKGKLTGWEFKFERDGIVLASVTKKWSGLGKEMFSTADNYVLKIEDNVPEDNPIRTLIFGAVMCIDKVLKE